MRWVIVLLLIAVILTIIRMHVASSSAIKAIYLSGISKDIDQNYLKNVIKSLVYKKNFFNINIDAIKYHLQQLPWIEQVQIRRIWPDALAITITATKAMATWRGYGLINRYGEVFYPTVRFHLAKLPHFTATDDQMALRLLSYYQQMIGIVAPLQLTVSKVQVDDSQSWQITLNNGMKLQLGQKEILTRLSRFVKVYLKVFALTKRHARIVDLRYQHGMAVLWQK